MKNKDFLVINGEYVLQLVLKSWISSLMRYYFYS